MTYEDVSFLDPRGGSIGQAIEEIEMLFQVAL